MAGEVAMTTITLKLRDYDDPERAASVADDIREAGEVRYTAEDGTTDVAYIEAVTLEAN